MASFSGALDQPTQAGGAYTSTPSGPYVPPAYKNSEAGVNSQAAVGAYTAAAPSSAYVPPAYKDKYDGGVTTSGGGGVTGGTYSDSVPLVQGYGVSPPAPRPNGFPMLADWELWIPSKPSLFQDGLPIYEILGSDAQIVQFPVRPGRQIMCFSGAMAYMSDGLKMDVKLAGIGKAFGRLVGGGSLFQITYTNESNQDGYVAMTPDYPGMIVPVNMQMCPSGKIICMRDSFLCATVGLGEQTTDVGAGFNPSRSVAGICCSGVDLVVQTVSNGEWAFLMAMGTIVQKNLQSGERVLVDTDTILAFEHTVSIDVERVGSILTCCCAGEGILNTTMTGPGKIWIQSMGIDKMRKLFPPKVQQTGGSGGDDGDGGGDGGD